MKYFYFFLLFFTFLHSEDCDYKNISSSSFTYKNTYVENGYLKGDYYINGNLKASSLIIVSLSSLSSKLEPCESDESTSNNDTNTNGADSSASDAAKLGLTEEQFNNQMATMANNVGFMFTFLMCFLAVLVMRK